MQAIAGILLGAMLLSIPFTASAADGYAAVKRTLYAQVFALWPRTLYCDCPFDVESRVPDAAACGFASEDGGERATRIEVEHVVPASWIGAGRRCWSEKICVDARGKPFKGRECCLRADAAFRDAYQDMHNLWPSVGLVNERRQNFRFGLVEGEAREFGRCDFEIDAAAKRAEPRPAIRGEVARISLYMAETHGVRLSAAQRQLFEAWDEEDPVDAMERRRDALVGRLQGRRNRFVSAPQM